jgi:Leucine-rich repeat (LRR) protein
MDTSSHLESPPSLEHLDAGHNDTAQLDNEIIELNRQITAAVVMELATGGLSDELVAIIEARDLLRTRLTALEGTPAA